MCFYRAAILEIIFLKIKNILEKIKNNFKNIFPFFKKFKKCQPDNFLII